MKRVLLSVTVLVFCLAAPLGCGENKAVVPTATSKALKEKPGNKDVPKPPKKKFRVPQ
jgi:hypothetical protein